MPIADVSSVYNREWSGPLAIGVDGCRDGWIAAILPISDTSGSKLDFLHVPDFHTLKNHTRTAEKIVMIDMPIGLLDSGRRPCEHMARRALGKRASSVFPAPRRPMLTMETYEEANQWGKAQGADAGGGLSKQAWNILAKIREIDEAITPEDQNWLGEAHPEFAFTNANHGEPCQWGKKTVEGRAERQAILAMRGLQDLPQHWLAMKQISTFRNVAEDDFLDACILSLTARARAAGKATCLNNGTRDSRGLCLEIWG